MHLMPRVLFPLSTLLKKRLTYLLHRAKAAIVKSGICEQLGMAVSEKVQPAGIKHLKTLCDHVQIDWRFASLNVLFL